MKHFPIALSDEKFQEIYTNPELRNAVAVAHSCCDRFCVHQYFKAMTSDQHYTVTEEQIKLAKEEQRKVEIKFVEENKNYLLFKGMGSRIDHGENNPINNYRFRTIFENRIGAQYFVEFVYHSRNKNYFTDHLHVVRGMVPQEHVKMYRDDCAPPSHNVQPNERAILRFINDRFNCSFTKVVVDDENCITLKDNAICFSPK